MSKHRANEPETIWSALWIKLSGENPEQEEPQHEPADAQPEAK